MTVESPPKQTGAANGSIVFLTWVCFVASLGGFLFGFDTAVISGTVEFVEKQFALSKFEVGWFGSSALVGCIIGAAVAGGIGDRFGRKPALLASGVFYFLSALICAIPNKFALLAAARIIGGVGVGLASVLAPMYISEFAPPRSRGRIVALYQLSIALGILAAYFSNYLLLELSRSGTSVFGTTGVLHLALVAEVWRGMLGAAMLPAALFTILLLFVPESPRWLVKADRSHDALQILRRIDGDDLARTELEDIRRSMKEKRGTIRELFRPGLRRALLVGVGLAFFGQMTGVNIVVYYGPVIMRDVGIAVGNALLYQTMLGIMNLAFTLLAIWKIDSWGRRPLLLGGMSVVALAIGLTAIMVLTGAPALIVVVLLGVYISFLAVSISAVIWVLMPEIFPNRLRGWGSSISTFTVWSTNAFATFVFPWYVAAFGLGEGFLTFAAICIVATVFFWKLVPETRGKSLEEIERMWVTR